MSDKATEILDDLHEFLYGRDKPQLRQILEEVLTLQRELVRGQRNIVYLLKAFTQTSRFQIGITRNEDIMNLQIFDDGKGVTYTATPDKALKAAEVPTWAITAGDATALVLTPSTDGLTCVGTLPNPAKDAAGIVATITLVRLDQQTVTDNADPIDIVPDPNGEVGSFTITEAAN